MPEQATPASSSEERKRKSLTLDLGHLTEKNLGQLKKLNLATFPVFYKEQFYSDLFKNLDYCRLGYFADILVGSICCRLEDRKPKEGEEVSSGKALYIMTLSVLKPYTRRTLAKQLVEWVIKEAECEARKVDEVQEIFLHVQTSNVAALKFYTSFGFQVTEEIPNYYKKIDPPDCYVLRKPLNGAELNQPVMEVPGLLG